MLFNTKHDAYLAYKLYAHATGFGTRIKYQQPRNTRNEVHSELASDGQPQCFYLKYVCTR
ncbi:hypothetical protein LINGRAHAP2_LOCUS28684, partial [Linum grandiflorum]